MADKVINITNGERCSYDGSCFFTRGHGFAWCYGQRYGTDECPLKDCNVVVHFKDGMEPEDDYEDEED